MIEGKIKKLKKKYPILKYWKLPALIIVVGLSFLIAQKQSVSAAALTQLSDVMTSQVSGDSSNHTFTFTTPNSINTIDNSISLDLTGFSGTGSIANTDIGITHGSGSAVSFTRAWSGSVLSLSNNTAFGITTGDTVVIKIGTNVSGGTHQLINPTPVSPPHTYVIRLNTSSGDQGTLAIPIVSNDQAIINAQVDANITMSMSGNLIDFGILDPTSMENQPKGATTGTTLTLATNAMGGYNVVIKDNGNNTLSGLYSSGGNHVISSTSGQLNGATTEGYGVYATQTSGALNLTNPYFRSSSHWVGGLTLAGTPLITRAPGTMPMTANDVIRVDYGAAITSFTPAGLYTDTVTYLATANY